MKSIFVPTDFSDCAEQATKAGIELAKFHGATLFLFTHFDLPKGWELMTEEEQSQFPSALRTIQEAKEKHHEIIAANPEVTILPYYSTANFLNKIVRFVDAWSVDLIVMGSHGTSGKSEYFIGSRTQKVVRRVHCPVLVIKQPLKSIAFKRVVFASNFNSNNRDIFLRAMSFVATFEPEIHLVHIDVPSIFDGSDMVLRSAMKDYADLIPDLECETHILRHISVDAGVRYFAEKIDADLIIVSNHYRRPIKRLLVGSNVEALVNHAGVPVLTMDYQEQ